MEENLIFSEVEQAKKSFGRRYKKLSGALTVEVLKSHLEKNGFFVSNRDVFIRGVDSEIDLLVIRRNATPRYNLIFESDDVVAALEVKNYGSFGKDSISQIRTAFDKIKSQNTNIFCCYITLLERESYKYRITSKMLGYPAYTIFFHKGEGKKIQLINTGEWDKFLNDLKKLG
jgi:hypothetical protein